MKCDCTRRHHYEVHADWPAKYYLPSPVSAPPAPAASCALPAETPARSSVAVLPRPHRPAPCGRRPVLCLQQARQAKGIPTAGPCAAKLVVILWPGAVGSGVDLGRVVNFYTMDDGVLPMVSPVAPRRTIFPPYFF
jgi:hypothetical protein